MNFNKSSKANEEEQTVELFWQQQMFDIAHNKAHKSHHQLPLARIKKIIKADKEVKMVSTETPIVVGKACEIFIQELTLRAWMCTEGCKRRTMQNCDIARAIQRCDVLDFLREVVPIEDHHCCVHNSQDDKEENAAQSAEGTQVFPPGDGEPSMENMGNNMVARDQEQFPQPYYTMQPTFLPPSNFPYHLPPKGGEWDSGATRSCGNGLFGKEENGVENISHRLRRFSILCFVFSVVAVTGRLVAKKIEHSIRDRLGWPRGAGEA
ncbi:hypothetical protein L6164_007795 [Bauhinia variegata]|uniref:Uncharacterized protein n=1 Tax=Bauhinia variegata TaxID=167791 RepID=A0ACB9PDP2_BAUVA|nr:hypothetical protein L6164_007795 [Bauhinia variegata]